MLLSLGSPLINMKFLVVLCALAAYTSAKPLAGYAYSALAPIAAPYYAPVPYAAAPYPYPAAAVVAAPFKSQYYAQDFAGSVSYGFAEPTQAQSAIQDAAGNKVGSFSFINAEGKMVQTNYVADALGYRVASNDLPSAPVVELKPVVDTPEVAEAKAKFFANFEEAKKRNRREVAPEQTPASTRKLSAPAPITPVAAPFSLAYTPAVARIAYTSPMTYPATFAPYGYPFNYGYPVAVSTL